MCDFAGMTAPGNGVISERKSTDLNRRNLILNMK
jgi:hypothetical protein